tara:strand:- start:232 stop:444 length:213 start_codon:yes stop_codon:yes gene_type:complete
MSFTNYVNFSAKTYTYNIFHYSNPRINYTNKMSYGKKYATNYNGSSFPQSDRDTWIISGSELIQGGKLMR